MTALQLLGLACSPRPGLRMPPLGAGGRWRTREDLCSLGIDVLTTVSTCGEGSVAGTAVKGSLGTGRVVA